MLLDFFELRGIPFCYWTFATWHLHVLSDTQVLGDGLPEVYRLLKQVERREMDELTRAHAQAALGELDTIMRELLFPQQTLAKKITVLDKLWPCCLLVYIKTSMVAVDARQRSYCWAMRLYISEQNFFTELWISLFPCRPWPAASLIPRLTHTPEGLGMRLPIASFPGSKRRKRRRECM